MDDEMRLLSLLQDFARGKKVKMEVFFDGAAPGWAGTKKFGGITAHFVVRGKTADEAIRQRLGQIPQGSGVAVVSSDRQIQTEARNHRAEVIPSGVFAQNLVLPPPQPQKRKKTNQVELNENEIDEWLQLFGDDADN